MNLKAAVESVASERQAIDADREIARLKSEAAGWKRKYNSALEHLERAEACNEFVDAMGEARDPEAWEREVKKGQSKATAIVLASDWHLEEPVDSRTVNGLNSFDLHEAEKRVRKFFTKLPEYVDRYCPMAKELWLWAGGDFISGYIHPELVESNQLSPTEASLLWLELWQSGLLTLRKHMPKVRVIIPTSFDNHGRTTEKMRVATAAKNSYTQLMYWVAQSKQLHGVEWRIAEGYHNIQHIQGRLVRFHHGHAIKYGGGIGGITIPVRKAIAQWNKSKQVDLDCFGHWHTALDGWDFVSNGPLIGYGAYSLQIKAEFQPPTQAFLVFDRKFGLRQTTKIFLTDG